MKNNILKIILVFSLLLNGSMLAAAGYAHFKQFGTPVLPFGTVQKPGETVQACIFQELSLKSDQQKSMQQKALAFHSRIDQQRQKIEQNKTFLINLLRADSPNGQAIARTIADINRLQEGIQKMVVLHMLEFKGMLDKDQQKKFLDLIEGVMAGKPGAHCP
jgi:hypothetical protein